MTTLATMKTRIADELGQRSDLDSQIGYAISDAIAAYQTERWYWSESRSLTFTTVAGQDIYTEADDSDIARIVNLDWVGIYINDYPTELDRIDPSESEFITATSAQGQPSLYSYYDGSLRLYPIPDAAYTVRIAAHVNVAEPASDAETSNPWMTKAERLIRSRAKLELALHVEKNMELARAMSEAVTEAYEQAKAHTNKLTGRGIIRPMCF